MLQRSARAASAAGRARARARRPLPPGRARRPASAATGTTSSCSRAARSRSSSATSWATASAAAALMAQMRTGAARLRARRATRPAGVAERLNRLAMLARRAPDDHARLRSCSTSTASALRAVNAGHLPPLLVAPAGGEPSYCRWRATRRSASPPATRYHEHEFELPSGSTLVLVTDGAVEVRGRGARPRARAPARLVGRRQPDLETLCDGDRQRRGGGRAGRRRRGGARRAGRAAARAPGDDAGRPTPTRSPACGRCCAAGCGKWRRRRRTRSTTSRSPSQEASANAVEHAYAPGGRRSRSTRATTDGVITVVVRDRGRWRAAARRAPRARAQR